MSLRPIALPAGVPGSLWLSSMPGRFESWAAFEAQARGADLALVVCLAAREEVCELSPQYDDAVRTGAAPFRWMHLPMRNFGLPEDPTGFRRDVHEVVRALRDGQAVLLHCAAGLGRTGTAAACVLKALGLDAHEALARVREAGSNPQNAQQSGLVSWF